MNVAVVGASDRRNTYSFHALELLILYGHTVFPVNPRLLTINGCNVYPSINEIKEPIDTVTLYVRPDISSKLIDSILTVTPKRIIMNPGSENEELKIIANKHGIEVIEGCTLVMLKTGQF